MNRETKRLLQRQGQLGPDGEPIASGDREERAASAAAGKRLAAAGAGGASARKAARDATGREVKESLPKRIQQFLREVRQELSRVAWASRSEVINYTIVVFGAIVFLTAVVYGLDAGFASLVNLLFKK